MKGARSQLRKDNISDAGKLLTKLTISRTFFPLVRPLWLAKKGPSVGFDDKSLAFFIIILLRSLFPKKRAKYEKTKTHITKVAMSRKKMSMRKLSHILHQPKKIANFR